MKLGSHQHPLLPYIKVNFDAAVSEDNAHAIAVTSGPVTTTTVLSVWTELCEVTYYY